jgi:hypothetical protein
VQHRQARAVNHAPENQFQNQGMEQEQKDEKGQKLLEELVGQ